MDFSNYGFMEVSKTEQFLAGHGALTVELSGRFGFARYESSRNHPNGTWIQKIKFKKPPSPRTKNLTTKLYFINYDDNSVRLNLSTVIHYKDPETPKHGDGS